MKRNEPTTFAFPGKIKVEAILLKEEPTPYFLLYVAPDLIRHFGLVDSVNGVDDVFVKGTVTATFGQDSALDPSCFIEPIS